MKAIKMRIARLITLLIAFSSVGAALFYLITNYQHAIYFTEPIPWIRNTEIILGIFCVPILGKMIWEEIWK